MSGVTGLEIATDKMQVTNIVSTTAPTQPMQINLKALGDELKWQQFGIFPSVVGRLSNGVCGSVFRQGYVRFAGAKTHEATAAAWKELAPIVARHIESAVPMDLA